MWSRGRATTGTCSCGAGRRECRTRFGSQAWLITARTETRCGFRVRYTAEMAKAPADEPQAFLALPFTLAGSPVVAALTKALHEHGVHIVSPQLTGEVPGVISEQIFGMLRRADFIVADLTDKSPNVFFELGLAMGLGKPVLLLSQAPATDIPFDIRARQIVVYRADQLDTISRYVDLWLRDVIAA